MDSGRADTQGGEEPELYFDQKLFKMALKGSRTTKEQVNKCSVAFHDICGTRTSGQWLPNGHLKVKLLGVENVDKDTFDGYRNCLCDTPLSQT